MGYYFSEEVIARQFFESLDECHIRPKYRLDLVMDGNIHRFAVEGDSSGEKSGAYFIHSDDYPNWGAKDFHIHEKMQEFKLDLLKLSPEESEVWRARHSKYETSQTFEEREHERKFFEAKNRERQAQEEATKERFRQQQYRRACTEYNGAAFGGLSHPYIDERFHSVPVPELGSFMGIHIRDFNLWEYVKEIDPEIPSIDNPHTLGIVINPVKGGPCKENDLLIPLIDAMTGKFRTLQIISSEKDANGKFQKKFYPGLPIDNACYKFAVPEQHGLPGCENANTILLCEGVFTGLAVLTMTRGAYPVFCAMTVGNLRNVAHTLRQRFPQMKIILMSDNDKATELKTGRNPGVEAAIKLKQANLIDASKIPQIPERENENVDYYDVLVSRKKSESINANFTVYDGLFYVTIGGKK